MTRFAVLLFCLIAGPVAAQDLSLPASARQISQRVSPLDSYQLPTGPFADNAVPARTVEGRIERTRPAVACRGPGAFRTLSGSHEPDDPERPRPPPRHG